MKITTVILIFCFINVGVIAQEKGTMTDYRDNKTYKTIKIGEQTWMMQNLAYKTKRSTVYNNNEHLENHYGRLYVYSDAKNSCPYGWKLPSDDDWAKLEQYFGAKSYEYTSNSAWIGETQNIAEKFKNNEIFAVKFSGVYGYKPGTKGNYNSFFDINESTYFWTSNYYEKYGDAGKVTARFIAKDSKGIYRLSIQENYYISVRCIKEE